MKTNKQSVMNKNMDVLEAFIMEFRKTDPIRLEYKSDVHVRITIDRDWTDFWPTTGKWYNPSKNARGLDVQSLLEFLYKPKKPTHSPTPQPNLSIRERLAIIDLHVAAIRAELFKDPKFSEKPVIVIENGLAPSKPYDDSWAKGDPFNKDEPPWNP